MFYRILISRPPALRHHCGKGNQEDNCSCHCYLGPPRDAIGVLDNPIAHKIQHYGHRDDKCYHYIYEKRAHKSAAHLSTGGAKHLAHGYLLLSLLDEIGGHRYQSKHGDEYGDEGKQGYNARSADLSLKRLLHLFVDKLCPFCS